MKLPRRFVGKAALFLVVLTVGITSPLLTMLSTLLLPKAAADKVLSSQIISLLGGHWGNNFLQIEVAISASALLVFASNTAIIGSYHVFIALSRMEFFPEFILKRNKLRGTPHYSIAISTIIPIIVLILVRGNINILGDMYAFGLLGAFTLTCLGMDIVRYQQRKARKNHTSQSSAVVNSISPEKVSSSEGPASSTPNATANTEQAKGHDVPEPEGRWTRSTLNFYLGILTTVLVLIAWSTNLIAKPLATAFGGSVAILGMAIAYTNHALHRRKGRLPVVTTGVEKRFSADILAVLSSENSNNSAIIDAALHTSDKKPVVFLYLGSRSSKQKPELFRLIEPHLNDLQARECFGRANFLAQQANVDCRFVYRHQAPDAAYRVWQTIHPFDTIVSSDQVSSLQQIEPTRVYNESESDGSVVHLLKEEQSV